MMKQAHLFHLVQPAHSPAPPADPLRPPSPHAARNIFLASSEKLTEHELQQVKSYEVVGARELKAYKNRAKKRTKVSTRDREELPSDRSISRESSKKKDRPDPELLNKEEVIDCLPKLSKELSNHYLSQLHKGSWVDAFSCNPAPSSPLPAHKRLLREFSLIRIKNKLYEHEDEWRRVLHSHKEGEKFPTLGESIVAYRQRREEAEGSGIDENLVNLKSSYWGSTLRNSTGIDDVCFPRREVRTLHEGVKAKGNSKLISETDWLEGKDQQGYKFKNCPDVTLPLPALKSGIR